MKAVILAAGKGKRLHSEQFSAPKVSGKPMANPCSATLSTT